MRPNHWHIKHDVIPLLDQLNVEMLKYAVESWNFNFNAGIFDQTLHGAMAQICFIGRKRE